jgi:hypothetical protein
MAKRTTQDIKRKINIDAFTIFGKSLDDLNNYEKLFLQVKSLNEKIIIVYELVSRLQADVDALKEN